MISKDPVPWSSSLLGPTGASAGGSVPANGRGSVSAGNAAAPQSAASGGNSYAFLSSTASSVLMQGAAAPGLVPATLSHERSQELCKYFLNGGCLRGAQCQYLHELPDERHLDVNGFGYILNPNVHNAQKTVPLGLNCAVAGGVQVNGGVPVSSPLMMGLGTNSSRQSHGPKGKHQSSFMESVPAHLAFQMSAPSVKPPPPKYRPPEPFLEYNLPPTLALPFITPEKDVVLQLTRTMLQN